MPTKAVLVVRLREFPDDGDLNRWRQEILTAFAPDEFLHDGPLQIVRDADHGPVPVADGSLWIDVGTNKAYYGEGYERGDPEYLILLADWLERHIPGGEVWYGHDVSDESIKRFGVRDREAILDYFRRKRTRVTTLDGIRWPKKYVPANAPVHVRNELEISAPIDRVWSWLIRAKGWPSWYDNSSNVRFLRGTGPDLEAETRFRWKTFWVTIESEVLEFVPQERIAWDAHSFGVDAYHAWLLRETPRGCHVLTEEVQYGFLAQLQNKVWPGRMYRGHQLWLEALAAKAAEGSPPVG